MTTRTKAVLGIVGVFVVGGICGALIFGLVVRERVREARNLREREGFSRFFFDKLQLSDSQNDSLRSVIDSAYRQLEQLRQESSQRYVAVIDTLRSRVYPQLTSEQRLLFEEQEQRMRSMVPPMVRRGGPLAGQRHGPPDPALPVPHGEGRGAPPSSIPQVQPESQATPRKGGLGVPPEALPDTNRFGTEDPWAPQNERRINRLMQRLNDSLELTDDQRQQIEVILGEQGRRLRELQTSGVSPDEQRTTYKNLRRQGMGRIMSILTPEQRAELKSMLKSVRRGPRE